MKLIESIIGMPVEKAVKLLEGTSVTITNFSMPDKRHTDTAQSMRVVKAVQNGDVTELFIAGFKDSI